MQAFKRVLDLTWKQGGGLKGLGYLILTNDLRILKV